MYNAKSVIVFSIHPTTDNRISKQIKTVLKAGYNVTYINSSEDNDTLGIAGVKHINIHERFRKDNIVGVIRVLRYMSRYICDNSDRLQLIHIHDPLLLPIAVMARKNNIKVVYDRHETYELFTCINGKCSALMEKLFLKYIDAVVYVADSQTEFFERRGFHKFAKIPNYQPKSLYCCDHVKKISDKKKIVYFGLISDVSRDAGKMLDCLDIILQKHPEAEVELAGKIQEQYIGEKIKLLEADHRNFHYYGVMKHSDVVKHTVDADIGILIHSDRDKNNIGASSNKAYEYLISGVAICGQGRFADWDKMDGITGCILPFGSNLEELVNVLDDMLNSVVKLSEYQANAKKLSEQYTWESVESRYVDLYNDLTIDSEH